MKNIQYESYHKPKPELTFSISPVGEKFALPVKSDYDTEF